MPIPRSERADAGDVWTYLWNATDQAYEVTSVYPCSAHAWTFLSVPIDAVYNDCDRRVCLRQNSNNSGWRVCINPYVTYYTGSKYRWPHYLEVGAAGKYCP